MAKVKVPDPPKLNTVVYETLKGVDTSVTAVEVDRQHSPDMLNMISDKGGNPVKRVGWRKYKTFRNSLMGNYKEFIDLKSIKDELYACAPRFLYLKEKDKYYDFPTPMEKADVFSLKDKVAITLKDESGGCYYSDIGRSETVPNNSTKYKIPEIVISRKPDGTGGTALDSINLLTADRTISFLGDGKAYKYNLYPEKEFNKDKYKAVIIKKVEVMDENGEFKEVGYENYGTKSIGAYKGYSRDNKVKFYDVCAPFVQFFGGLIPKPIVTGQDNVKITFAAFDMTPSKEDENIREGFRNKHFIGICESSMSINYGYGTNNRVFFLSDNNRIYFTALNDLLYIPDDNYIHISNTAEVIGFHRYDRWLVVLTKDSNSENFLSLVEGISYDEKTNFKISATISGEGAVSAKSSAFCVDEPLFLSNTGVYGIVNRFGSERSSIERRSMYIDRALLEERNLDKAVAVSWRNYYILGINNKLYILDGRQRTRDKRNNTNFNYEGYIMDNVPMQRMVVHKDELYFLNGDTLCKFNTDVKNSTSFSDGGELNENGIVSGGVPIKARWSSCVDYDGHSNLFKTLNKKGNVIALKPYAKTSVKVFYGVNGLNADLIDEYKMNQTSFKEIDFRRFSFVVENIIKDVYVRKKVKKYKALQIVLINEELNEPFGIIKVTKTISTGNYAK